MKPTSSQELLLSGCPCLFSHFKVESQDLIFCCRGPFCSALHHNTSCFQKELCSLLIGRTCAHADTVARVVKAPLCCDLLNQK